MTAPGPVSSDVGRSLSPSLDSELTWLLHRAAQRMHVATGEAAAEHGLLVREFIVLSALSTSPGLTQVELGRALGLDKTTLMSQLDRLEGRGLVQRRSNPHDRRARIPAITGAGETLRAATAAACAEIETGAVGEFGPADVRLLRRMLIEIIGESDDPGSCL